LWPKEETSILEKRVLIPLEIFKGVSVEIKQPTLTDELLSLEIFGKSSHGDAIADTVCIEKFIREFPPTDTGEKKPKVYLERTDIVEAFFDLPPRDRKLITKSYEDNFGKYKIDLKMKSVCPFCNEEQDTDIDIVQQFFRMVFSAA
jgi:hypothetical protein